MIPEREGGRIPDLAMETAKKQMHMAAEYCLIIASVLLYS